MRKAVAEGFYPSNAKELEKEIEELLKGAKTKEKPKAMGIISPHAGYAYSGLGMASAYNAISGKKFDMSEIKGKISEHAQKHESVFDTFIILGVNHTGYGNAVCLTDEDFEIPSGVIETDKEFCRELIKKYGKNELAHKFEHSIEVQLPFLRHLFKNPKIVPIVISLDSYEECLELAEVLEKIIKKLRRNVCVIASSDFTHYGYGYGFLPFSGNKEEVRKKLYELDGNAIKSIEKLDGKKFFEFSRNTTICGASAIAVAAELCKKLGARKAKLLKYYTSGDISNDYSNAVGYASVVFE